MPKDTVRPLALSHGFGSATSFVFPLLCLKHVEVPPHTNGPMGLPHSPRPQFMVFFSCPFSAHNLQTKTATPTVGDAILVFKIWPARRAPNQDRFAGKIFGLPRCYLPLTSGDTRHVPWSLFSFSCKHEVASTSRSQSGKPRPHFPSPLRVACNICEGCVIPHGLEKGGWTRNKLQFKVCSWV